MSSHWRNEGDLAYATGRHPCGQPDSEEHVPAGGDLSDSGIKALPEQVSPATSHSVQGKIKRR